MKNICGRPSGAFRGTTTLLYRSIGLSTGLPLLIGEQQRNVGQIMWWRCFGSPKDEPSPLESASAGAFIAKATSYSMWLPEVCITVKQHAITSSDNQLLAAEQRRVLAGRQTHAAPSSSSRRGRFELMYGQHCPLRKMCAISSE